jgi:hypothetical protein
MMVLKKVSVPRIAGGDGDEGADAVGRAVALGVLAVPGMGLQPARRQHRREREGDEEREHRRHGDGEAELAEETADVALHEGDRHVHHHVQQRDRHGGEADLVAPLKGGHPRRFAELQVAVDVLQHHDAVVHQDADQQRQGHQAHQVEAEAHEVHHQEGGDERRGDGQQHDERVAPGVQEEQQHGAGDQHRQLQVELHVVQRVPRVLGGVVRHLEGDALRHRALRARDGGLDAVGHLDAVRLGLLGDRQADGVLAVEALQAGQVGVGVGDVGHVLEEDGRRRRAGRPAAAAVDDEVADVFHALRQRGEAHVGLDVAQAQRAGGGVEVLGGERVDDLLQRDVEGLEAQRIDLHLDLALAPAGDLHVGHAAHAEHRRLHDLSGQVVELGRGQPAGAGHDHVHDRKGAGIGLDDGGGAGIRRQLAADGVDALLDVDSGLVEVGGLREADADAPGPERGGGADLLDAPQAGDGLLDGDGDELLDVARRGTGVVHHHRHVREVGRRQAIDGQAPVRLQAHDDERADEHQNGHRARQGESGQSHPFPPGRVARTVLRAASRAAVRTALRSAPHGRGRPTGEERLRPQEE